MNLLKFLLAILVLFVSCSNDDGQESRTDYLVSILSDCNLNREIFNEVDEIRVQVVFDDNSGLVYFREVLGFDSQNTLYVCEVDEKFKNDGLILSVTGILKLFTENEREALGPSPVGTERYLLEPTDIKIINSLGFLLASVKS